MNLTSVERLLLSMELRKLAAAEPGIGYEQQAEIIENGYSTLYGEVFGIVGEPELDSDVQEEVYDILNMFRALHPGHTVGSGWDPDGDYYYQKFRGFDGNAGTGHYGLASFLIRKFRRFQESDGEMNSHSPTLEIYRDLLVRWNAAGRPPHPNQAQIDAILGIAS